MFYIIMEIFNGEKAFVFCLIIEKINIHFEIKNFGMYLIN